jgi:hypothetical protein
VQVRGGEVITGGDVGKAYERVHQRDLPRVIEFQTWDALPVREAGRFGELPQLPAIDERLEEVLLDREIAVGDGAQFSPGVRADARRPSGCRSRGRYWSTVRCGAGDDRANFTPAARVRRIRVRASRHFS